MCLRNSGSFNLAKKQRPQTTNMQIATFADGFFWSANLRICDLWNLLTERPSLGQRRMMNSVFINEVA